MLPNNDEVLKTFFAKDIEKHSLHCKCALHDFASRFCPGLDGINFYQVLDFYWTDPIDAMIRSVAKLQYKDKLYTTFKPGMSITEPMVRAFDEVRTKPIPAWCFSQLIFWIHQALPFWLCFMLMPHFLDKA